MKSVSTHIRPKIPYENPGVKMHCRNLKEQAIRLAYKRKAYTNNDDYLQQVFADDSQDIAFLCGQLVSYVAEGFEHYAVWDYTHAYYPGVPSQQSAKVDAMEGVSRVLPTLAAWLSQCEDKPTELVGLDGKPIDIIGILKSAFLSGTDPAHRGYWGVLADYDQRTCESADLALALWLSRHYVWCSFTEAEQCQVIAWFKQVNQVKTVDNNWHLFPLMVQCVVFDLTDEDHIESERFQRIKSFHVGSGWFRDGENGNFDFYNAWGFHYSLFWIQQIAPTYEREFITNVMAQFATSFRYFFSPKGIPFFGRSACYRLSASAPLLAVAGHHEQDAVSVGQAKRALSQSLRFFISRGAMRNGAPTQGLFRQDLRLVDNYSGPASSFWSLRALNIALYRQASIGLWNENESRFPVEKSGFNFKIKDIEASVIGVYETKEVVIVFHSEYEKDYEPLQLSLAEQSWPDKLLELFTARANRPKNNLLRKGVTCFSSKLPHYL